MSIPIVLTFGVASAVFYAAYFAWILGELLGATLIPRLRYGPRRGVRRDRGSFLVNIITLVFAISVDFFIAVRGIGGVLPVWTYYLGIVLLVLGIAIRQWAIAVLGRFFTLTVKIQKGQKVVEEGPYRLVRHPSYTGLLLSIIGIALGLQSWVALLINLVVFGVVFGYRIHVEEKALVSGIGEEYVAYSKRTKRLIPFVI